jgi:catechol 2,3-dioxygenase-like lactoylglutathione lyase family enzyme
MLAAVCVGTNNLKASAFFYDKVLAELNMFRSAENDIEVGYGSTAQLTVFWVIKPFNNKDATFGNGSQVIFEATDQGSVTAFHATAMAMGGQDEGGPGPRDYEEGYFGAYVRDLDGNKLHVFCISN